jgi:excisionase family DNA binding protein
MPLKPSQTPDANLDIIQAARRLNVSPSTLRLWALVQHKVSYLRLGRRILFTREDLAEFEARGRVPAKAPPR